MSEIRRKQLSEKFLELGQALLTESMQTHDINTEFAATFMVTLGTVIVNDNDTYIFNEICNMYTGRKILDSLTQDPNNNPIINFLKETQTPESKIIIPEPKKRAVRKKKGPNDETPPKK